MIATPMLYLRTLASLSLNPLIVPIALNSSKRKYVGTSKYPFGDSSACVISDSNAHEKNSDRINLKALLFTDEMM